MRFQLIGLFVLIYSSLTLGALKIKTIHPDNSFKEGHTTVFLNDGEIVHILSKNTELVDKAQFALELSLPVELVKLPTESGEDTAHTLKDILLDRYASKPTELRHRPEFKLLNYDFQDDIPLITTSIDINGSGLTDLRSTRSAKRIMKGLDGNTHQDSQCYNRAHMWTYSTQQQHNIDLGKIWIMFTKKYIREYNYKWWFHVAPIAKVKNDVLVLDKSFTKKPATVTNWKNIFIKSHEACTITNDYTEVEDGQESGHCYLLFSNQYYYQPSELISLDGGDIPRDSYFPNQVMDAYRDALINWSGEISGIEVPGDSFLLKLNETVVDRAGVQGVITRLRGDMVMVRFQGTQESVMRHKQEVGMLRGSSAEFNYRDRFSDSYRREGIVTAIFMGGYLGVVYDGESQMQLVHKNILSKLRDI